MSNQKAKHINNTQRDEHNILYKLDGVSKHYGKDASLVKALDKVNLQINKKELTVITGDSGSGKTTLLNVLAGIVKPTSGNITFEQSIKIENLSRTEQLNFRREKIGYIYQNYNLIAELNILQNIRVASYLVDNPMDEVAVLKLVDLQQKAKSFPEQLSGGQQQRACIARALVKKPQVLLCDEPTGALDTQNAQKVIQIIKNLISQNGASVVMITHNPKIANLADHYVEISNGQIVKDTR